MWYGPNTSPFAIIIIKWHKLLALLFGLLLLGWAFYDFRSELLEIQDTRKELREIKEMALELHADKKAQKEINNTGAL